MFVNTLFQDNENMIRYINGTPVYTGVHYGTMYRHDCIETPEYSNRLINDFTIVKLHFFILYFWIIQ
jgi:hypothetical protein